MTIDIVLYFAIGRGGLEDVITKVTNGLINKGHRVRVFQCAIPTHPEWVYTVPEMYFYAIDYGVGALNDLGYRYAIRYGEMLKNLGTPDVIIATHLPLLSFMCKVALQRCNNKKIPIISWIHGPVNVYGRRELLSYSDAHMAISTTIAKDLATYINPSTIYHIGNPVTTSSVLPITRSTDQLRMLYIGRIAPEKNLPILFTALNELVGNWELNIIGDGIGIDNLKSLAINYNIADNIHWLGWQDNPWNAVSSASATIVASDYEGFSMTTSESLARGIPVISTKCGGPEDMIIDDYNGWLYPVRDSLALKNILQNILDGTYTLPSTETCITSIQKFSDENVINKIDTVLTKTYNEYYESLESK